jgi:hypothetical protein
MAAGARALAEVWHKRVRDAAGARPKKSRVASHPARNAAEF